MVVFNETGVVHDSAGKSWEVPMASDHGVSHSVDNGVPAVCAVSTMLALLSCGDGEPTSPDPVA